jgi:pilus assembly protein CpaC
MILNNAFRILRSGKIPVALAVMLCFSPLSSAQPREESFSDMVSKFVVIPPGEPESEMLAKAAVAVNFIKRMELPQASKSINEALQLDARNSYLHFFNGFIYHLQARQGDSQKNEMAIEGYQQALRIDPSNWIAQEFLGLAYLDLKQFAHARDQFSEVLLMSPESTVSIYGLMVASYMTGDPVTACAMADRFSQQSPEPHSGFIRSSVSVYASCGEFEKADRMRLELGKLSREPADVERVGRRLAQWKSFYRTQSNRLEDKNTAPGLTPTSLRNTAVDASPERYAQAFPVPNQDARRAAPDPSPEPATPDPATAAPAGPAPGVVRPEIANDGSPRMVLVDVVMVSTQELVTTAKGINLLNALTLQFGSATAPAFSHGYTRNHASASMAADVTTVITRAVTIPALAYSLNIANAANNLNEVLARPTLAAIEGLPSEFFSGMNLNAAVVSTSSLGTASAVPVDKRFGVKLAVTPNFLPNGMVKLKVEAQRTFLNANVDNAGFAYRLEISETSANANVVLNLGDTLVLSGLSEKESSSSRTGVPVLQDVPVLQYLFSTKRNSDFQRSVLILITPRAPVYTSKMERGPGGAMTDSMRALREKLGFSGRTPANVESILNHLRTTNLFREFRQGDVSLERWDRMHSTGDRLRQALDFLYY